MTETHIRIAARREPVVRRPHAVGRGLDRAGAGSPAAWTGLGLHGSAATEALPGGGHLAGGAASQFAGHGNLPIRWTFANISHEHSCFEQQPVQFEQRQRRCGGGARNAGLRLHCFGVRALAFGAHRRQARQRGIAGGSCHAVAPAAAARTVRHRWRLNRIPGSFEHLLNPTVSPPVRV